MTSALIFMHIPKCGGTTLVSVLKRVVPEGRRFHVGDDIAGSRMVLAALPDSERLRIDLLYGHLSYGWHEHLLPRQARYFTIVRDPVTRVMSHYNFVRSRKWHYLHSHVVDAKMTVADYVESGVTTEVNNGQVRQISGIEDIVQAPYGRSEIGYGDHHGALLERAWENIERHFLLVGLLERFDESMRRLRRLTGLRFGKYRAKNVVDPALVRTPTPGEAEVIRRYNREDCELYGRCKKVFEHAHASPARARFWRMLSGRP
jgi:hypothetical protein